MQSGLVRAHDFGEGFKRYEPMPAQAHHEHLICERCGRVVEFQNERLERMLPVIADEHAFQHQRHRVEIYGVCRECRQRELGAAVSEPASLGLFVAFAAGLLSFLSPCVLPLVPSYIGFLTGMSLPEMTRRRRVALVHALLFVPGSRSSSCSSAPAPPRSAGRSTTTRSGSSGSAACSSSASAWSASASSGSDFLMQERRVQVEQKPVGYLGSRAGGDGLRRGLDAVHRAGARRHPRSGRDVERLARGMLLLAAYSAGLAVPFVLAAFALESFLGWFQRFRRYLPWVMRVSGALLVFVGILMVTGEFTRLAGWLQQFTPEVVREKI